MVEGRSRLRLGARIGRGGMAEVFAGKLVGVAGFEKDVAVKRVLPKYAGDPKFLSRFLDEARLAARLSHPNIVQIFELGQEGADHYIVMEAVRGKTLRAVLEALGERGEKMPVTIALHIAHAICSGLAYAHELRDATGKPLGIVHRDVSPQNVLLGFEGAVKLIDFGIARAQDNVSMTQVGQVVGKPHFMAPEQVLGDSVDARADVFALGLVLFEMLAGQGPYDDDGVADVGAAIVEGRGKSLSSLEPTLDGDVVACVNRALELDPAKRWESTRDFAGALLSVMHGRTRTGAHDLEAMLSRLFPAQVSSVWPVESLRADAKDHTQTVDVPIPQGREITLVSDERPQFPPPARTGPGAALAANADVTDPQDTDEERDSADNTLADVAGLRRRSRAPLVAAVITLVVIVAALAFLVRPMLSTRAELVDAGIALVRTVDAGTIARGAVDAGGVSVASGTVDAGVAAGRAIDAGAFAGGAVDAGAFAGGAVEAGAVDGEAIELGGVDAGVAGVAAASKRVRKAVKMGKLVVETRPWTEVRVNGRLLGITPLSASLPVGEHQLKLTNPEQKLSRIVPVTVSDEKTATVRVDLRR